MAQKKVVKKKKASKAKSRRSSPKPKRSLVNTKVLKAERQSLIQLANRHAKGNLSAWLRHAALNYRPAKAVTIR